MFSKMSILVLISVLLCHIRDIDSFNLSPHANTVFKMPATPNPFFEQTRSSYFGFAMTLRTDGIMISAPRAQTTLEMQRKLNETGAIYKCTFGNAESPSTCAPFVFDNRGDVVTGNSDGMYRSKMKEQQWLGMSMDGSGSPTDKFVVCAPKMITPTNSMEHYLLHGMCYVSMSGTEGDKLVETPIELAPLRRTNQQVHSVGGFDKLFYMYGEMGLNVHVSEDNEEILIGAPGVYNWKGTVVRYKPRRDTEPGGLSRRESIKRGRNIEHSTQVEYETDVPQPHLWDQSDDSYLGFAVTSGYFGGKEAGGKMLYAASAPQAQPAGEVYVFDIVDYDSQLVGAKVIKKLAILSGLQMGEYFGYSLLADDFNRDGFTDLVIGAPSHSFDGYHEQGCVYYYQNVGNGVDFEMKAKLSGDSMDLESRFGTSLGRIGDLDNDGYVDLAVGAPFENKGAVYIFSGGPEGIRTKSTQKIVNEVGVDKEQDPDQEPPMFGMSITRGVDIDGNSYNDIAIGAPNAESVQLYKSFPVVKVVASIVTDKRELAQTDNQVRASVCIQLVANVKNLNAETNLRLKFKLDPQFGRATFDDQTNLREWETVATEEKQCQDFELIIRPRLEFIFRPLELELHYENAVVAPAAPDFCEKCVAVSPNDPTFVTTKLVYMSGCASEKCVADLRVTSEPLTVISPYIMGSTRIISFQYTVENLNELAYLPQMRITKSSQLQFAKIPPNCQAQAETLLCDVLRPYLAKGDTRSIVITFDTSNMDGSSVQVAAQVMSSSDELHSNDNIVTDVITVTEFSELESTGTATPSLVSLDTAGETVSITHSIALRNEGPSTIQRLKINVDIPMFHDADYEIPSQLIEFSKVTARARYNNRDLATSWIQNDTILIQNPTEQVFPAIADELDAIKYDNYKLGFPDFEQQPDQQQMEQMQSEQVFRRRKRRSIQQFEENAKTYNVYTQSVSEVDVTRRILKYSYDDVISNRSITFDGNDCDIRHQCVQLELFVSNFRPSRTADITIDVTVEIDLVQVAKLFNEKRDALLFRLGLRLKKENDETGETISHQSKLPYTTILTTIPESTPLWIYIVSIICGLLFFTLLTYGLYRCGFFRREKREEIARLTRQSKIEADETDDD